MINHHLFFSDQLLLESGVASLLPAAEVVVFDEAHQLNDTGIPFLGHTLGTGQLRELARDLAAQGPQWARASGRGPTWHWRSNRPRARWPPCPARPVAVVAATVGKAWRPKVLTRPPGSAAPSN